MLAFIEAKWMLLRLEAIKEIFLRIFECYLRIFCIERWICAYLTGSQIFHSKSEIFLSVGEGSAALYTRRRLIHEINYLVE